MTQSRLKTICFIRHLLKDSTDRKTTAEALYQQFPSFQDEVIDAYVFYEEKSRGTYNAQKKLHPYETEAQKRNKKSETEKIEKLKNNMEKGTKMAKNCFYK